jgi:hypothetical protein
MPVAFTIMEGQDSLLLLPILVFAYRRIGSNERQAGILLGLGMFRFQVLLPIVALFLLWRSLKFVAAWVAGSAAVLSISAAITGVNTSGCCVRWAASQSVWLLLRRIANLRCSANASRTIANRDPLARTAPRRIDDKRAHETPAVPVWRAASARSRNVWQVVMAMRGSTGLSVVQTFSSCAGRGSVGES